LTLENQRRMLELEGAMRKSIADLEKEVAGLRAARKP